MYQFSCFKLRKPKLLPVERLFYMVQQKQPIHSKLILPTYLYIHVIFSELALVLIMLPVKSLLITASSIQLVNQHSWPMLRPFAPSANTDETLEIKIIIIIIIIIIKIKTDEIKNDTV